MYSHGHAKNTYNSSVFFRCFLSLIFLSIASRRKYGYELLCCVYSILLISISGTQINMAWRYRIKGVPCSFERHHTMSEYIIYSYIYCMPKTFELVNIVYRCEMSIATIFDHGDVCSISKLRLCQSRDVSIVPIHVS